MKYKLAIFDMDGTILDTLEDLMNCTNYALSKHGYPIRSLEEIRCFVGNGLLNLMKRAIPKEASDEIAGQVLDTMCPYYKEHCADKTKPYDGIIGVLETLRKKGYKTAVVSNKADFAVQQLCEEYFPGLFDVAIGEREGVQRKPAPDSVNEVLKILNLPRAEAVYIGDSEVDYMTSQNAGLDVIMVGWGFRKKEEILSLGAPFVVDTMEELLEKVMI